MDLTGRQRSQTKTLLRSPARAWTGVDPLARIASCTVLDTPAVCPTCSIVCRLINISERDSLLATEQSLIPSMAVGDIMRDAQCVLCTTANIPSVRAQEASAGHIWFLIGDPSEGPIPSQPALNQHFWAAIANTSPRKRAAARNQLLDLAAQKAFGSLLLPHLVISSEDRAWLMGTMRKSLGEEAGAILGEETLHAFIAQFGVPLLVTKRIPKPEWAPHVRFIPTPEGVEAYRKLLVPLEEERPPKGLQHKGNR